MFWERPRTYAVVNYDKLTYAGNLRNLDGVSRSFATGGQLLPIK
jgi:dTDP-D-glucose 4,6-dehydratase